MHQAYNNLIICGSTYLVPQMYFTGVYFIHQFLIPASVTGSYLDYLTLFDTLLPLCDFPHTICSSRGVNSVALAD